MTPYKNRSRNSGLSAYNIGADFIKIRFTTGPDVYVYDYLRPVRQTVERMKVLAVAGKGLSAFIATKVRDNYSRIE
jgi:hypothetical protein